MSGLVMPILITIGIGVMRALEFIASLQFGMHPLLAKFAPYGK